MPEATSQKKEKVKRTAQARGLPAGFGLSAPLVGRRPVQIGDYLDDDAAPSPTPSPMPSPKPSAEATAVAAPQSPTTSTRQAAVPDPSDDEGAAGRSDAQPVQQQTVEPKAAGRATPAEPLEERNTRAMDEEEAETVSMPERQREERHSEAKRRPTRRGEAAPALPATARSRFTRNGPPRKQINMRPETLDRARELLWLVQEYGPQPDAKASEMFEALVDLLYDARSRLDLSEVPLRGKWGDASAREFPQYLKRAFADAIMAHQGRRDSAAGAGSRASARAA